jgi:hypothetical protein
MNGRYGFIGFIMQLCFLDRFLHQVYCQLSFFRHCTAGTFDLSSADAVSIVSVGSAEIICTFEDDGCSLMVDDSFPDIWEVTQGADSSDNTLNLSEPRELKFLALFGSSMAVYIQFT